MTRRTEDEILDLLILGGYSFIEVAEMYEMTVKEIKRIYRSQY